MENIQIMGNGIFYVLVAIFLLLTGINFVFSIWFFLKWRGFSVKKEKFFSGKDGKNLEDIILKNIEKIKKTDAEIQDLYDISNKIYKISQKSLQKIAIERFNPFKDIGGEQSFSLCVLNDRNSGFILSSLLSREGARVYIKPILSGESKKYSLMEEEKDVLEKCINNKT